MHLEKSGTSLNPKRVEFVEGSLKPMGDRIVVRPLPVKLSQIIIAARQGNFLGTVMAVGPGEYPWIYNRDRSKRHQSKHFRPTEVKIGDVVELGGQEHDSGYAFTRVCLNGEDVIVASEKDVAAVHQNVGEIAP